MVVLNGDIGGDRWIFIRSASGVPMSIRGAHGLLTATPETTPRGQDLAKGDTACKDQIKVQVKGETPVGAEGSVTDL
ncbi:hypothetical protein ABT158_14745 [Nonomuraea sp. NPDC001636]|uniref:hypothetical protein n=1 Tax=Nonomuraea sp. NPDC001636 TaxID=3154391 RepID=UPI00332AFB69